MKSIVNHILRGLALTAVLMLATSAGATVFVQCPGDGNGDADFDDPVDFPDPNRQVRCMHLAAGDGFTVMPDGKSQYIFGFADATGMNPSSVITDMQMKMTYPAPTIAVDEGDEFYLTLTNVGMINRPDLFDPHSVHWHGFPQAAPVFDGLPESSFGINMMSSLTYYYNVVDPGTFMYHCHIEAVEHMQMGMLGNLYVRPAQNRLPDGTVLTRTEPDGTVISHVHDNPDYNAKPMLDDSLNGDKYTYNDGDGSTYYDVEYPVMMGGFDPNFHDASENVLPLPFADMKDTYTNLNGRGYPDTVSEGPLMNTPPAPYEAYDGQPLNALIKAKQGEKILLRLVNLNITHFWTMQSLGVPMTVVGVDSRLLRSEDGTRNLYYTTNSVTLGGGQAMDIIMDTTNVAPGTYFLHATDLYLLSNDQEDFGGMMTEIVIEPNVGG